MDEELNPPKKEFPKIDLSTEQQSIVDEVVMPTSDDLKSEIDFETKSKQNTIRNLYEPDLAVDEIFLEHNDVVHEKIRMRKKLGMSIPSESEKKLNFFDSYRLRLYRAGITYDAFSFLKLIVYVSLGVVALLAGFFSVWWSFDIGFTTQSTIMFILLLIALVAIGSVLIYSLLIVFINAYLDIVAFKRCLEIERVLPEFLRLVATNFRSGLPLDKAIYKSNRKRFGVLSKEIDLVAKITFVKGDLGKALLLLGKKFDSKILQRAMTNITLSINSGSNISNLLEDIATNITKMRILRASMAANVKNYVIFIIVAGVVIAPLMFAMSGQMNVTISDIRDNLAQDEMSSDALMQIPTGGGLDPQNFNVFAMLMILTNSITSGLVISMIQHGNYKQGLKQIPIFMGVSLLLYYVGTLVMTQITVLI